MVGRLFAYSKSLVLASLVLMLTPLPVHAQEPAAPPAVEPQGEEPADIVQPAFRDLDQAVADDLGRNDLPQDAALWLGTADQVLMERYYGRYDRDTVVPLSSASQWLAAATLLSLVDAERLSLDDPLIQFFPQVGDDKIAITVRQLLSHTSGLVAYHPCVAEHDLSLAACAEEILDEPAVAPPGTQVRYGAAAFQVAGRVAEIAAGPSWNEIFRSALALPLGLEATGWPEGPNPTIATGASGNAADYGRFLTMLLNRGQGPEGAVLSEDSVAELFSDQTASAEDVFAPWAPSGDSEEDDSAGGSFGLGVWLEQIPAEEGEESPGLRASCPAILGFAPWIEPGRGVAGALMILQRRSTVAPLVSDIQARTAAALAPEDLAPEAGEAP
ncbi:MAG: serine hydrolase domain-containing protein [Acidobacteriota bacterium]|nr:serine hydrolase domain-containing protein [Acidobacteriota bacterium]